MGRGEDLLTRGNIYIYIVFFSVIKVLPKGGSVVAHKFLFPNLNRYMISKLIIR